MSARLAHAGHRVHGFDVDEAALDRAGAAGVERAQSVAHAVSGAAAVSTMLPAGEHVRSVYAGPDGVWAHADPAALLADSSTVDLETSAWSHAGARERGLVFVDAPVSGGVSGAAAGTLTFMLGGEAGAKARAHDLVRSLADRVFDTGGPTNGIATKLANNLMLFIAQQACAELARKDLALAVHAGEAEGVHLPAARVALAQFERLIAEGLGHKDCSLVVKYSSPQGTVPGFSPAAS